MIPRRTATGGGPRRGKTGLRAARREERRVTVTTWREIRRRVAGEGEGDVVGTDGEGLRVGEGVESASASARGGGGRRDGESGGIVLGGVVEEHLVRAVRHAGGVRQDVGVEGGGEGRDAGVERERGEPRLGRLRERTTQRRER